MVCAQLHFNIYMEIGVKLDNKFWFDQSKQFMNGRLSCYGANTCEMTELFLTTNWTSKSAIIQKDVNRCCNFWRQKCDQEISRKDFKI